jgi:hypothetical protein
LARTKDVILRSRATKNLFLFLAIKGFEAMAVAEQKADPSPAAHQDDKTAKVK